MNDRKARGEAYRHQCSCRVRNQQKCRFARLESVPNHRRKEAYDSQQELLLSNFLQQRRHKCRALLYPDAFTKGAYSPAVLNAASRLKLATVYSGAESTKTKQMINGAVSSLRLRVGSVPEAI
ncbi:hypothetical protein TNCV_520751 [Trichonephila clavipes]|nr:hypothetical protein TNCV_520751 [Trichonephila clavipes]